MPPPRFEPIITLGNVITLISMILAIAGTFYTTRAEVDELRRAVTKFETQISTNTNKLAALEEWKSIGPRFTANDGAVLKATAISESQNYTNSAVNEVKNDIKELSKKVDNQTSMINDIRVLVASQNRARGSGGGNGGSEN